MKQTAFQKTNWQHRYAHGGSLRNKRAGRRERVISSRDPIHLVLKAQRECVPGGFRSPRRFRLIHQLCDRYAKRFFVKIEKISVQGDHLHLVARTTRRSGFQNFLRVFSGQIAQRMENRGLLKLEHGVTGTPTREDKRDGVTGTPTREDKRHGVTDTPSEAAGRAKERRKLWKYRPFTRVVKGRRAYVMLQNYVQLNEQEARGLIPYRKERLKGLRDDEWRILWS